MEKSYLIGRWPKDKSQPWEVQGVFDSEDEAKRACEPDWFVMPIEKNVTLPKDAAVVGYYPRLKYRIAKEN